MNKKETEARATSESLAGKVAVVTGASRGIGRAIAEALLAHECRVVAASRSISVRNNRQPKTENRLRFSCDVRDEDSVAKLFATVKKQFGRVDILINNAGTAHALTNIERLSLKTWREVLDT